MAMAATYRFIPMKALCMPIWTQFAFKTDSFVIIVESEADCKDFFENSKNIF